MRKEKSLYIQEDLFLKEFKKFLNDQNKIEPSQIKKININGEFEVIKGKNKTKISVIKIKTEIEETISNLLKPNKNPFYFLFTIFEFWDDVIGILGNIISGYPSQDEKSALAEFIFKLLPGVQPAGLENLMGVIKNIESEEFMGFIGQDRINLLVIEFCNIFKISTEGAADVCQLEKNKSEINVNLFQDALEIKKSEYYGISDEKKSKKSIKNLYFLIKFIFNKIDLDFESHFRIHEINKALSIENYIRKYKNSITALLGIIKKYLKNKNHYKFKVDYISEEVNKKIKSASTDKDLDEISGFLELLCSFKEINFYLLEDLANENHSEISFEKRKEFLEEFKEMVLNHSDKEIQKRMADILNKKIKEVKNINDLSKIIHLLFDYSRVSKLNIDSFLADLKEFLSKKKFDYMKGFLSEFVVAMTCPGESGVLGIEEFLKGKIKEAIRSNSSRKSLEESKDLLCLLLKLKSINYKKIEKLCDTLYSTGKQEEEIIFFNNLLGAVLKCKKRDPSEITNFIKFELEKNIKKDFKSDKVFALLSCYVELAGVKSGWIKDYLDVFFNKENPNCDKEEFRKIIQIILNSDKNKNLKISNELVEIIDRKIMRRSTKLDSDGILKLLSNCLNLKGVKSGFLENVFNTIFSGKDDSSRKRFLCDLTELVKKCGENDDLTVTAFLMRKLKVEIENHPDNFESIKNLIKMYLLRGGSSLSGLKGLRFDNIEDVNYFLSIFEKGSEDKIQNIVIKLLSQKGSSNPDKKEAIFALFNLCFLVNNIEFKSDDLKSIFDRYMNNLSHDKIKFLFSDFICLLKGAKDKSGHSMIYSLTDVELGEVKKILIETDKIISILDGFRRIGSCSEYKKELETILSFLKKTCRFGGVVLGSEINIRDRVIDLNYVLRDPLALHLKNCKLFRFDPENKNRNGFLIKGILSISTAILCFSLAAISIFVLPIAPILLPISLSLGIMMFSYGMSCFQNYSKISLLKKSIEGLKEFSLFKHGKDNETKIKEIKHEEGEDKDFSSNPVIFD